MKKYIILSFLFILINSCISDIYPPLIITGAVTNIDKDGAEFHAKITELGKTDIIEFGFVWDTIHNPTIEKAEKYVFHSQAEVGNYVAKVSASLTLLKPIYVRAFIRNAKVTTYGEETSFVSQGGKKPEIISISPALGNLGDTLVIAGKNFSVRSSYVIFDHIVARPFKSIQDSIYVLIPASLNRKTSAVSISIFNQTVIAKDSFTLISSIISNLEPKTGTFGDEVTISGKNFLQNPSSLRVFFDGTLTTFRIIDDQTIKAIVPNELGNANCNIRVIMNNQITESVDKFSLTPVEISDFSPKTALTGGTITITGRYFSPTISKNKVYVGGVLAKSISVTNNTLSVSLSLQDTAVYESRNATVKVDVGGNIRTFDNTLLINDKWFRRANAPLALRSQDLFCTTCAPSYDYNFACCFAIGKTAYIGLNNKKDFWAYNTDKNIWYKLSNFPGVPRIYGSGFVFDNKIYFGTGMSGNYSTNIAALNDWWEYDPASDKWTQKATFIGGARYTLAGYSTSTGCYLSNGFYWNQNIGHTVDIWKYNPISDVWNKEIIDLKGLVQTTSYWKLAKVVNDDVYICFLDNFYGSYPSAFKFNTRSNTFTTIKDFPYEAYSLHEAVSMVLNNTVYIRTYNSNFYYYDRTNNSWKFTETKIYSEINNGIAFEVDNIGFAGLGESNQLYEFDPNR